MHAAYIRGELSTWPFGQCIKLHSPAPLPPIRGVLMNETRIKENSRKLFVKENQLYKTITQFTQHFRQYVQIQTLFTDFAKSSKKTSGFFGSRSTSANTISDWKHIAKCPNKH